MHAESPAEPRTPVAVEERMHRCAAGRSCRDPVIDGDTRAPAVIAVVRGLCDRCYAGLAATLEDLERDYGELAAAVRQKRTGPIGDHVSGTPTPPIPINLRAEALARSLAEWAEAALGVVAEAMGIDHPVARARGYPHRDGAIVAAACRIVAPNVDRLLAAPVAAVLVWDRDGVGRHVEEADGIDIALRLTWIHRQAIGILGDPNPRERLAMPCPVLDCGAPTLGRSNGSTDVTCTTCGGRWSEREYAWLAGLLVSDYQKAEAIE